MQFKKHVSLFIAFLLLVSNSGLAFNVHYCEGKLASISSVFSKEEVCDMSNGEMAAKKEETCCAKPEVSHKKCCSDKKINLKNKTEKIVLNTITFDLDSVFLIHEWNSFLVEKNTIVSYNQNKKYYCDANAPPLYQLYCQFTLFG
jgi:hypothetical protein